MWSNDKDAGELASFGMRQSEEMPRRREYAISVLARSSRIVNHDQTLH